MLSTIPNVMLGNISPFFQNGTLERMVNAWIRSLWSYQLLQVIPCVPFGIKIWRVRWAIRVRNMYCSLQKMY